MTFWSWAKIFWVRIGKYHKFFWVPKNWPIGRNFCAYGQIRDLGLFKKDDFAGADLENQDTSSGWPNRPKC